MDAILKASLPKLREKLLEALQAVLPIVAIVLVLCFTIAPVSPSILLCFLLGAVLIVVGIMFFTLGAEMSMTPMGERVGAVLTRSRKLPVILGVGFLLGFLITISEPDLQVLANQVPSIPNQTLIFSVAAGVGLFLTVAFLRMLLGVALQMGILLLCGWVGAERAQQDLLVCMITYTLLFSLTVTSFFSMPVTRYLADMLYEEREDAILPSFWGSSVLMLLIGCILYGIFLLFSGATLLQGLLCLWLFAEMILNWNGMSYLTAIKDYRGILCSFLAAIALSFGLGYLLVFILGAPVLEGMLFSITMGYGLMMVWDVVLLYRYFPQSDDSPWTFLRWVDRFLPLAFTGLCTNLGLFSHLVLYWSGPIGVQVKGLFYGAPYYDVPALIAFLSILITSINFVVSVEVNFYPKYRDYYSLFNDGGVVGDIVTAEEEMLAVLNRELRFTALKQLFCTAGVISLAGTLLNLLPLGFNDLMHGYFRTLCVGYGLYAVGNTVLLILLYFTDYLGAVLAAAVFAASTTAFTLLSLLFNTAFYGFGFLAGAALFYLVALFRLDAFTANLPYRVLGQQPIVAETKEHLFTRLGIFLEKQDAKNSKADHQEGKSIT